MRGWLGSCVKSPSIRGAQPGVQCIERRLTDGERCTFDPRRRSISGRDIHGGGADIFCGVDGRADSVADWYSPSPNRLGWKWGGGSAGFGYEGAIPALKVSLWIGRKFKSMSNISNGKKHMKNWVQQKCRKKVQILVFPILNKINNSSSWQSSLVALFENLILK